MVDAYTGRLRPPETGTGKLDPVRSVHEGSSCNMKNIRLEGVLDGLGRNMKAAFEPEFPGQSSVQQEAKDYQNTIAFWRLALMQVCRRLLLACTFRE